MNADGADSAPCSPGAISNEVSYLATPSRTALSFRLTVVYNRNRRRGRKGTPRPRAFYGKNKLYRK